MELTGEEQAWLDGRSGRAHQLAMRLMVAAAEASGTSTFVPIEFAHINSCHWSGRLSVDFAEFLRSEGATLAVPTHTNASLIDCSQPALRDEAVSPEAVQGARRLMEIYETLGCSSMWSCAPYHQPEGRPRFGAQIAGSESNAVAFFNSVLGARTEKYGDLLDISAAITGRVPYAGLHTDEGRLATEVIDVRVSDAARTDAALPHLLGVILGQEVGTAIPVVTGLDALTEDELKAIAAAGATAGSVSLFHVAGVTPEAPTVTEALGGRPPQRHVVVDDARLDAARRRLGRQPSGPIDAVCLGTPHFSVDEFGELLGVLDGRTVRSDLPVLVTTSRAVDHELGVRGWRDQLRDAGVTIVLDTCTYYTPVTRGVAGTVMTNSAKWAYYAPGILGVDVAFGSLSACVEAAVAGEVPA
ncbi:MAG: aconitase X catalytic domain-containing protein [Actinomycetota bacterium]